MNFEQLTGFVEVAATGHFTRAAQNLHLAQPSLSRQIATLEQELAVQLFHRARGNVTLTSAGERLLPLARRMLVDAATARADMADLAGLRRGRIRVGATPTLCTSLLVDVLTSFRARYPGVDIEVLERGSRSLIEALTEGALDLALVVTSVSSPAGREVIEREALLEERLVLVSAASGAAESQEGSGGGAVSLEELSKIPQIMFPENYDLRVAVDAAFSGSGLEPTVAVAGAEMDAALRFVERGLGAAVVPAMVALDRPALRVHALEDPSLSRTVSIARRSDMALTHAASSLLDVIRETTDRLLQPGSAAERYVARARG